MRHRRLAKLGRNCAARTHPFFSPLSLFANSLFALPSPFLCHTGKSPGAGGFGHMMVNLFRHANDRKRRELCRLPGSYHAELRVPDRAWRKRYCGGASALQEAAEWCAAVLTAALAAAALPPATAHAGGLFDFLFRAIPTGNVRRRPRNPMPNRRRRLGRWCRCRSFPRACARAAARPVTPSPIACGCATASTFRSNT